MDEALPTVTARRDGPLVIEGLVRLVSADGTTETAERLFLCRCGQSAVKPRCDGSHKRVAFTAEGEEPPPRTA
jgi:CDGSH-type Zn-finger protein